jgi:hypothetical protein
VLGNNATVNGSIYSGGNVTGSNGATITGTAVASNPSAASANQSNLTPTTPTSDIAFGDTSASADIAQSISLSSTGTSSLLRLYVKKIGNPSSAIVHIVADSSGSPGTTDIALGTLNSSFVTSTYGLVDIVFTSNVRLVSGTTYWVVIDSLSTSLTNYYVIGGNSGVYSNGQAKNGIYGGVWSVLASDLYFSFYLEGTPAVISGVTIGTGGVGDANAHTVNSSTIAGLLYCQVGSSNNKACNRTLPDPVPQNMPISEGNISQWTSDATAGGTVTCTSGSYTPAAGESLGPKKVPCNLVVANNFTLTGTLWVTGNVTSSNGKIVTLSSALGTLSSVIVVDGTVSLSNNSQFNGTGQAGSYIMLLSNSTSATAIDVSNNAGAVILNAQKGTVHMNNNSGAKEVTANTIYMDNNATVTYESGLANTQFSSGPAGGYVPQSWKEIE